MSSTEKASRRNGRRSAGARVPLPLGRQTPGRDFTLRAVLTGFGSGMPLWLGWAVCARWRRRLPRGAGLWRGVRPSIVIDMGRGVVVGAAGAAGARGCPHPEVAPVYGGNGRRSAGEQGRSVTKKDQKTR
jgi:hypothetical protein